jgi:hypothetical protein
MIPPWGCVVVLVWQAEWRKEKRRGYGKLSPRGSGIWIQRVRLFTLEPVKDKEKRPAITKSEQISQAILESALFSAR